jgi:predicted TIM-barrel fold metal-dependent hydrolase
MSDKPLFERVISGDSHVREPVDLWSKALASQLGDRAPRAVSEYGGQRGRFFFTGQRMSKYGVQEKPADERTEEEDLLIRAGFDPHVRIEFQRRAGVAAEVLYPSLMAQIMAIDDAEIAQKSAQVYNDWIAEYCSADPKRLIGVAALPVHDIAWACAELRRMTGSGCRGALVNVVPPPGALPYIDSAYDPLWALCEEAHLPVILHIITGQEIDPLLYFHTAADYARAPRAMFAVWNEVQETLANDFIFGGVLDRFPGLNLLCGEYEISWIPHFMFRLDQLQDDFADYIKMPPLKMRASDYMRQRVFHGMIDDPIASDVLPRVGASQVLWGSDFPHVRSIGLGTQGKLADMLGGLSHDDQISLVGGNATRLFAL